MLHTDQPGQRVADLAEELKQGGDKENVKQTMTGHLPLVMAAI